MRPEKWEARRIALATCAYMGLTLNEAAVEANVSVPTARSYARRFGIKFVAVSIRETELVEKARSLAAAGATRNDAAAQLGCTYQQIATLSRRFDVDFARGYAGPDPERAEAMSAMFRAGKTLNEIGHVYGVSRERVRQIIAKTHRLSAPDGGQAVRARIDAEKRRTKREADCLLKHGCSRAEMAKVRALGRQIIAKGGTASSTPLGAYTSQRSNAKSRGIAWNLVFWEWWSIWQESGKWEQRGRAADAYVMCRFRDDGPYEIGNVYIATLRHNSSVQPNNPSRTAHPDHAEYQRRKRSERRANPAKRVASHKPTNPDLPLGVTRHKGRFIAQCSLDGQNKYLGSFGTPEDAHRAYLAAIEAESERAA